MNLTFSANSGPAIGRLADLPARLNAALVEALKKIADRQVDRVRANFSGRPGLISRSHTLRDSFRVLEEQGLDGPSVRIVSDGGAGKTLTGQPYGGLQETGGVITPKNVSALTIPLPWNRGPDGLPIYRSAAELRAQGRTRLIHAKDGRTYIMVREDKGYVPMWILKTSARVPGRLGFLDTFRKSQAQARDEINDAVKGAL